MSIGHSGIPLTRCLNSGAGLTACSVPGRICCPFKYGADRGTTMRTTLARRMDVVRKPPKANGARAVLGVVTGLLVGNGAMLIISGGGSTMRGMTRGLGKRKLNFLITRLNDMRGGRAFVTGRPRCPTVAS